MTFERVRDLKPVEAVKIQLLEQRIDTLEAKRETLRAVEAMLRAQFRMRRGDVWRVGPDTGKLEVARLVPEPQPEPAQ